MSRSKKSKAEKVKHKQLKGKKPGAKRMKSSQPKLDGIRYNRTHPLCYPSGKQHQDRAEFDDKREDMAELIFEQLDERLTGGAIARATHHSGGVVIQWTPRFRSRAGDVRVTRECAGTSEPIQGDSENDQQFSVRIRLGAGIITNERRLWCTVAHEFCHVAVRIVDGRKDVKHGPAFMRWGKMCEEAFPEQGFTITARHRYEIEHKYLWRCSGKGEKQVEWVENDDGSWTHRIEGGCGHTYGRHSRSIDTGTERCGNCGGHLVQVMPIPQQSDAYDTWRDYQKSHFAEAKAYLERWGPVDIGMVTSHLGQMYKGVVREDGFDRHTMTDASFIAPSDDVVLASRAGHLNYEPDSDTGGQESDPLEYDSHYEGEADTDCGDDDNDDMLDLD
ncbi:HMG box-containing protein [Sphaceloma murrayae]|uniref:HMG box-containing protein n=1 Tax=Sphaceloma murrayae TaxID=2082308 RepID=A0A2K1QWW7_9PEZI|nr:HMG box-containing protein [Sphaceloma murrayae]